jgi:hypothetical protein
MIVLLLEYGVQYLHSSYTVEKGSLYKYLQYSKSTSTSTNISRKKHYLDRKSYG